MILMSVLYRIYRSMYLNHLKANLLFFFNLKKCIIYIVTGTRRSVVEDARALEKELRDGEALL